MATITHNATGEKYTVPSDTHYDSYYSAWVAGDVWYTDMGDEYTFEADPAPDPVTPAAIRRAEIEAELTAIDAASARPLRAILTATTSGGTADPADVAKLTELEAQAKALREELATLVG